MAGRKKIDTETIKSNYGFTEASEQAVKTVIGINEEAVKEKKEVAESVPEQEQEQREPKRKGRKPLVNREKKKRYSFTVLPSVYDKAQEKAEQEGRALSELVSDFLKKYGNKQ